MNEKSQSKKSEPNRQHLRFLLKCKATPEQLALIAAPIYAQQKGDYEAAVIAAANLLAVCNSKVEESQNLNLVDAMAFNPWGQDIKMPRPKDFPTSLDEMLRLIMPGMDRVEDRLKRFRDYLKETLAYWDKVGDVKDGKDDLIRAADWIADRKARDKESQNSGLTGSINDSLYYYHVSNFHLWRKQQRSVIGRKNVSKRKPAVRHKKAQEVQNMR